MLLTLFIISVYIFHMQCVKATIDSVEHLYTILMFTLLLIALHHYDHKLRELQRFIDTVVWTNNHYDLIRTVTEFILKDYKSSNLRCSINRLKNFFLTIK